MLVDVVEARALEGTRLFLRFEDGTRGELDIGNVIEFSGVFSDLRDPKEFSKVRVHAEFGTVCWPNGADIDPDTLYAALTGEPIDVQAPAVVG